MALAGMAQLYSNVSLVVWWTVWQTYQAEANLLEQLCHLHLETTAAEATRLKPQRVPGVHCSHCLGRGRGTGASDPKSCYVHQSVLFLSSEASLRSPKSVPEKYQLLREALFLWKAVLVTVWISN